jgi:hypothetical protein
MALPATASLSQTSAGFVNNTSLQELLKTSVASYDWTVSARNRATSHTGKGKFDPVLN